MNEFVIYTDSSADLPAEIEKELGIKSIQLDVRVGDDSPRPNNDLDIKEFYNQLRNGKMSQTSAVSIESFKNEFTPTLKEGKDILYIGFSSGLSSTYNWGKVAAEELSEEYTDRKLLTVDTLAASLGQGMLVWLAAKKKQEGATIEEVAAYVEEIKLNLCHWFTVDDLFFLKRGGRISSTTAVVGTMLSIKPVLHVDNAGKLINVAKARGRKGSIAALAARMKETAINPSEQTVFISHGDCIEDAETLKEIVKKEMNVTNFIISPVGPVIGSHSGPGTLALFFLGTKR